MMKCSKCKKAQDLLLMGMCVICFKKYGDVSGQAGLVCKRISENWDNIKTFKSPEEKIEALESKLAKAVDALASLKNAGVKISCLYIGSIEVNTKTIENIEDEWVTALDKTYHALAEIKGK